MVKRLRRCGSKSKGWQKSKFLNFTYICNVTTGEINKHISTGVIKALFYSTKIRTWESSNRVEPRVLVESLSIL